MDYDIYTFLVDWLHDMHTEVILYNLDSGKNVFCGPAWQVADTKWATQPLSSIRPLGNQLELRFTPEEEEEEE